MCIYIYIYIYVYKCVDIWVNFGHFLQKLVQLVCLEVASGVSLASL